MTDVRVDDWFAEFRDRGDPERLAAVFDATAPELLRVARHLAGDAHAAEDLVQATFLKAIEHRDRYDPELPVLPWLLGILANTARHERRLQRRVPLRLGDGSQVPVVDQAAQAETAARLHEALRRLPQPYREVLLLQVEHGLDSGQVAEITGRKPSTVRTQIARGMDLLRGALPVAVGAGLAGALPGGVAPDALAAVREFVLRRAVALTAAGGSAATGTVLGGLAMKKLAAVGVCLSLVATGWWWLARGDAAPAAPRETYDTVARVAASGSAPGAASVETRGSAVASPRAEATPAATASLRVSVRHADGSVADGVGVYVAGERLLPFGREASTGAAGSVRFDGLSAGDVVVKPDRAAGQPLTLVVGANELDVRLADGVDVDGRVAAPDGKIPIPHAGIYALSREHHDHAQRLGEADAAGVFRLRGIAAGTHLFARAAGWQPGDPRRDSVPAGVTGTRRVELRVGARATSLRGRVTLPGGEPAAFALVAIGVDQNCHKFVDGLRGRKPIAGKDDFEPFLVRADEAGCFTTDEVPPSPAIVLARPAVGQPPAVGLAELVIADGADNRCDVALQPGAQLRGTVRDEAGAPIAGMELLAEWKGTARITLEGGFEQLLATVRTATDAEGNYRLDGLLAGEHEVMPRAGLGADLRIERQGEQRERVTLLDGEHRRFDFTVARRGDLAVRLLGADGGPLAGFGIWVGPEKQPTPRMSQLEAQRTDADGRVRIRGVLRGAPTCITAFGPRSKEAGDRLVDRFPARQWFDVRVGDDELELRLATDDVPAAAIAGRFVDRDGSVLAAATCDLRREQWQEVRRLAVQGGSFATDNLPAGRYWLQPAAKARPWLGPFDVAAGQRRELGDVAIDEPGRLRLVLRAADGGAIKRPYATLSSDLPADLARFDERDGALVSSDLQAGQYRLWLSGDDVAPSRHVVGIRAGEQTELRLELPRGFQQRFEVVPAGPVAPASGGWLVDFILFPDDEVALVHRGTRPTLAFDLPMAKGTYTIRWNLPGGDRSSQTFTLSDRAGAPIVLRPK